MSAAAPPTPEPAHPAPTPEPLLLRELLAASDASCPRCRYNLRGLTSDRCPECNQPLTLRLDLANPCRGSFIAGLIGIGIALGANGVMLGFLGLLLLMFSISHLPAGTINAVWFPLINAAVLSAVLILWLRARRRMRRMGKTTRTVLAVSCWVVVLIPTVAAMLIFQDRVL